MSGGEGNPFPYSSMKWKMVWSSPSPNDMLLLAGVSLPFHRMLTLPPSLRRNLPSLVIRGLRRDLRYALNGSRLGDLQGDLRHVLGFKFKWYLETPGHFMEYPPPEGIPFTSSTSPRPA